jgi:hypothetical protein
MQIKGAVLAIVIGFSPFAALAQFEGGGRSCSQIAMLCQSQCTGQINGGAKGPQTPESCAAECGGYRAACMRGGTWTGRSSTVVNVRRE